MSENERPFVEEAFDLLAEALGEEVGPLRDTAAAAIQRGDYAAGTATVEHAQKLDDVIESLAGLRRTALEIIGEQGRKADPERLPRGVKTPQATYRRPILAILAEMGGSAKAGDVLDAIYLRMKDQLNAHDLSGLNSSNGPRWRNTAQWARNTLREEGLIASDSPRGTWEITAEGRQALERREV